MLLKLRGSVKNALYVLNASPEVYDIFAVTGFTKLLDVRKRPREISVEGCEEIGSGAYGRVYRLDPETIAKLYSPSTDPRWWRGSGPSPRRPSRWGSRRPSPMIW